MKMVMEFPHDSPVVLGEIAVYNGGLIVDQVCEGCDDRRSSCGNCRHVIKLASNTTIAFTVHTPDGDFTYTIDNVNKTLTTESETPFLV